MKYEAINTQVVMDSDRLVLRPLRRSDAGLMQLYVSDKRVAEATSRIPHPLPPGAIESFIARALDEDRIEDVWVLDGTKYNYAEVVGIVSLTRLDRKQSEIGYWIAPAFWNTGLASEAVETLLKENPQDSDTIFAQVFQDNPASARVLTKAGFEYLGDAEGYSVAREANVATWTYLNKLK